MTQILKKLGLSYPSDEIYLSILKTHRTSIAEISKDTGIYRPTIYRTLPLLLEKGLISKIKIGKRTLYFAENPTKLHTTIEDLKSELDEKMPELSQLYEGSKNKPLVSYVEGRNNIQKIYGDLIRRSKKGDEFYRYESPRDYKTLGRYYPTLYWKHATGPNAELEKWVITNEQTEKKRSKRLWRHVRIVPESYDPFDYNITQLIYKDTVCFIDYDTETATVIKSKRFAEFQLKIYHLLFGKLK